MLIEELTKILEISWSKDTCTPSLQDSWNENNKALGQCAITALIVNDFLGGKIMRCMSETGSHYYNIINDHIIDLTSSQFEKAPKYIEAEKRTRDYLLSNEDTKPRDYVIILALYDGQKLEDVTALSDTAAVGFAGTVVSDTALTATKAGLTAQIYVWDSWSTMAPKTDASDVLPETVPEA